MTDVFTPKNAINFTCINCHYKCCKQSDFNRHLLTRKHANTDKILTNTDANDARHMFTCDCGKKYKHRQSLFNHKKKYNHSKYILHDTTTIKNTDTKDELINFLMKETQDFKKIILEICKNNTTNITTNSHNKTFNLNLFLNETCKDAMNIMDFVESVKLDLTDLETIGHAGFVNGISKIIIKNLKDMDVTKRPLHCTDSKREVLYVKDENKWEKENEEKEKLRKVINHISNKNIKQIPTWVEENPNCKDSESNKNTEYLHIVGQSMGCTDDKNYQKIIHNISKEVMVDK